MDPKTFGLDIGTTSIKALLLKKDTGGIFLESIAVAPSTAKGVLSESLVDQQLLADSIRHVVDTAQIKISDVNISIPESQVYTKIIELPLLSEQELRAALTWEIDQYIPLPANQVRTDWQILEKKEVDGKKVMNVLLVAAPLATLNKYEQVMNLARLNVQTIETEIISVHRALYPLVSTTAPSLIVHLGASMTSLAVIKNGIINTVFTTSLGGIAITRAVSLDLGIDVGQAEDYKKAYGLNQEILEGKVGKSLNPILESIVGDIKKTILTYREKNNNDEIKQIILSGGSSLLPGLDVYFTNVLGLQVVLANSWKVNNISKVPEEITSDAPSFNVVVGLSLHDIV